MLTEKNRELVLENGKPIACEDCCHCDDYLNAGFSDSDVIWKKCEECQERDDDFTRNFWSEKVKWHMNGDVTEDGAITVRVNGQHYVLNKTHSGEMFLGHGGRKFIFRFIEGAHAGKVIECRNVWYQGTVDDSFKELLPDNAVAVRSQEELEKFSEVLTIH